MCSVKGCAVRGSGHVNSFCDLTSNQVLLCMVMQVTQIFLQGSSSNLQFFYSKRKNLRKADSVILKVRLLLLLLFQHFNSLPESTILVRVFVSGAAKFLMCFITCYNSLWLSAILITTNDIPLKKN